MTVIRLATSQERRPVPGCGTCRFHKRWGVLDDCLAVGTLCATARIYECRDGRLWEPKPTPVPVLVRFKRWLIG